jgi:hypothetical protein
MPRQIEAGQGLPNCFGNTTRNFCKESARKPRLKEPGAPLVRSNEWENYELRADSHLRLGPAFIDSHGPSLLFRIEADSCSISINDHWRIAPW